MKETLKTIFDSKSNLWLLLILVSILIIAGGYLYYSSEEETIRKFKHGELESISKLKIDQITEWYSDELADANFIARDIFFVEHIQQILAGQSPRNKFEKYLESLAIQHSYANILICNVEGELLISINEHLKTIDPELQKILTATGISDSLRIVDIYRSDEENSSLLDIISPVVNEEQEKIALLIFRIDVQDQLDPVIHILNGISHSPSSEVLLLRKETNGFRILSSLKYADNSDLNKMLPANNQDLPSSQGFTDLSGLYEAKGYTGKNVLIRLSSIPGTPWFMAVQVNKNELYAEINSRAVLIFYFVVAMIVLFGSGLISFYTRRQRNLYESLYHKEKELWQSKEQFKLTLDSIGEGVITTDLKGKIEYMNRLAEELTGWKSKEAIGKNLHDVYTVRNESTGKLENNILDNVLKHGIIKELANHTILVSRSGKEIPVIDTGAPIRNPDNSISGVVLVFEDETEKRKQQQILKESEERVRSTLDNMMEGCQILRKDWRYLYINKAGARHGRTTRQALLGRTIMEVYPGIESTPLFKIMNRCMDDNVSELFENEFVYPDGSKGWFELSIQPVKEGIFILSQDISERKHAEEALIQAKEQAEEMSRVKSIFFSNMSHEMRTPLVAILGFADLLKEQVTGNNKLVEMTDYIRHGGKRLLETLELVLNISQLESEKTEVDLKDLDIIPILREITNAYYSEALNKKINYKFETSMGEIICNIDEKLFRNIFNYLINNAFKYTEQGSITVTASSSEKNVIIQVADSGIGIPEEKQHLIWNEFRQVSEGLARKFQGAGLGLTIAKKYVELIGGNITLESTEGKGTVFSVQFSRVNVRAHQSLRTHSLE